MEGITQAELLTSITKGLQDVKFNELPDVRRAREDFRSVCTSANVVVTSNLDWMSMTRNGQRLNDCLVVPFNVETGASRFPASKVKVDDPKMYIAIVCYQEGTPIDVLLVQAAMLKKIKAKLDKNTGEYVFKCKNIKHPKLQQYSFGVVVGQFR